MAHKKGSLLYMVMILVLCSTIISRNHRLMRSHMYLERGIYSMDVRVNSFLEELYDIEAYLHTRFSGTEELLSHLGSGRKILYGDFTISLDSSYNKYDVHMILILDKNMNYQRKVMVIDEQGAFRLINKGV